MAILRHMMTAPLGLDMVHWTKFTLQLLLTHVNRLGPILKMCHRKLSYGRIFPSPVLFFPEPSTTNNSGIFEFQEMYQVAGLCLSGHVLEPQSNPANLPLSHPGHHTGAHATRGNHKGAHATLGGAHDTCGNHKDAWNGHVHQCRDGVIGPHAYGSVGRQVVDDQDNMCRGGAIGPHSHGNTARHVMGNLNVEGSG